MKWCTEYFFYSLILFYHFHRHHSLFRGPTFPSLSRTPSLQIPHSFLHKQKNSPSSLKPLTTINHARTGPSRFIRRRRLRRLSSTSKGLNQSLTFSLNSIQFTKHLFFNHLRAFLFWSRDRRAWWWRGATAERVPRRACRKAQKLYIWKITSQFILLSMRPRESVVDWSLSSKALLSLW